MDNALQEKNERDRQILRHRMAVEAEALASMPSYILSESQKVKMAHLKADLALAAEETSSMRAGADGSGGASNDHDDSLLSHRSQNSQISSALAETALEDDSWESDVGLDVMRDAFDRTLTLINNDEANAVNDDANDTSTGTSEDKDKDKDKDSKKMVAISAVSNSQIMAEHTLALEDEHRVLSDSFGSEDSDSEEESDRLDFALQVSSTRAPAGQVYEQIRLKVKGLYLYTSGVLFLFLWGGTLDGSGVL